MLVCFCFSFLKPVGRVLSRVHKTFICLGLENPETSRGASQKESTRVQWSRYRKIQLLAYNLDFFPTGRDSLGKKKQQE